MREALVDSRNIPALKAFQAAGKDNIVKFAGNLGLNINSDDLVEAYAIGGFGNGVSPLQMAGAYSAFMYFRFSNNDTHFVW